MVLDVQTWTCSQDWALLADTLANASQMMNKLIPNPITNAMSKLTAMINYHVTRIVMATQSILLPHEL